MNPREYTRLLLQMLLLPLLALAILAAGLAYSLQRVQRSAALVDHSDRVIAHANRLLSLIVDEETGVRGYTLTHDPSFLEPYNTARNALPQEFDATNAMIQDNPIQVDRLRRLRQHYQAWDQVAQQDVQLPPLASAVLNSQKQQMDAIRAETQNFLNAEELLRQQRSVIAYAIGSMTRWILIGLIVLIALITIWITRRSFSRCRRIFRTQLDEVEKQRILLAEQEEWLNTTLRSIGDGVIVCDPNGNVVLMNPVAEELTGWGEEEAKGRPLPEIFHIVNERTRATVENPVDKVRRTGNIVALANHTVLIRKDGSECGIDDSASPIRRIRDKIVGVVLVFRDCTERRSSEMALMRAEKLAAAGKLAASIAHEVNNPLEGLTNVLYLANESTSIDEIRQWLMQAQGEVDRLSYITRRTLGFYRENAQSAAYRPADVVEEVLSFYVPEALSKNVQLEAQIRTQQEIFGTPGELRQVLSNLIANSLDAMPHGGVVRLVVRRVTDLRDSTRSGVRITVADNGHGIPRHLLKHIFEPFFTTKQDTGTGLGLWVSKELIEKHGGSLRVHSSIAGAVIGTAFSMYLPTHSQEVVEGDAEESRGKAAQPV